MFSDICCVRANGLGIGSPRLVGGRKAENSNMQGGWQKRDSCFCYYVSLSAMEVKDEVTPVRRRPHSWEEAGHFMETAARTKSARTGESEGRAGLKEEMGRNTEVNDEVSPEANFCRHEYISWDGN